MASKATDGFQRPNGPLGNADTGQPWVTHRGTPEIRDGRALVGANGMFTVDVGVGGGDGSVLIDFPSADGAGQALYFRVFDVNRWWRLSKSQYSGSYSYVSGYTEPTYGWVGNGTFRYEPAGEFVHLSNDLIPPGNYGRGLTEKQYYNYDYRVNAYLDLVGYNTIYQPSAPGGFNSYRENYQSRTVYENQTYQQTAPAQPIYSTAYYTVTEAKLERCVNGQITVVKSASMNPSVGALSVNLNKESITCWSNEGLLFSASDPTHMDAKLHGFGRSDSQFGNSLGIESFSAVPSVISGYVPPLML